MNIGRPLEADKYLAWNSDAGPRVKDASMSDYIVFENDRQVDRLRFDRDMQRNGRDYAVKKKMAELCLIGKVLPNAPERDNYRDMLLSYEISTEKVHCDSIYVPLQPLGKDKYEFNFENIEFSVHKVGKNFGIAMLYKAVLVGTELVSTSLPVVRKLDMASNRLVVDFKECRNRDMPWSSDAFLSSLYYRVMILDPNTVHSPTVA